MNIKNIYKGLDKCHVYCYIHVMKTDGLKYFNIDALAKRTGVSRRTIRYYVQRELLPKPEGGGRGHYYTTKHLERIKEIQRLQSEGVPLDKMKELFSGAELLAVSNFVPRPIEPKADAFQERYLTRINIGPEVELNFRPDLLTEEDVREIQEFINSILKRKE